MLQRISKTLPLLLELFRLSPQHCTRSGGVFLMKQRVRLPILYLVRRSWRLLRCGRALVPSLAASVRLRSLDVTRRM